MRLDIKLAKKPIDIAALNAAVNRNFFGIPLKIASLEYILLGKIWFLGDISDVKNSEFLEYNDIKDFINVFIQNRDQVKFEWLEKEVQALGLYNTLERILNYINEHFQDEPTKL
jgi:hypothetical protein